MISGIAPPLPFRDRTGEGRIGLHGLPPSGPALRMAARKAPQVLPLAQRAAQASQHRRRLVVFLQMIAVEQQAARPQDRRDLAVHRGQLAGRKPVQGCRADCGVRAAAERQSAGPARRPQVTVSKTQPAPRGRGVQAERQQERVSIHRDHGGSRQPAEQPDRQRSRSAAEVDDQRIRPICRRLDGVDQRGESFLAVGHRDLLLGVPAADPGGRGPAVDRRRSARVHVCHVASSLLLFLTALLLFLIVCRDCCASRDLR